MKYLVVAVLLVGFVGCTGGDQRPTAPAPPPPQTSASADQEVRFQSFGSPVPPGARCPTPPRAEGAYQVLIGPTSGQPGTRITMGGNTPLFNKAGRYLGPSGKIGFWFNLPSGGWEHVYFGGSPPTEYRSVAVIHLGEVNVEGQCSYRASFRVPDVPPSTYSIVPIEHDRHGSAAFLAIEFQVTS